MHEYMIRQTNLQGFQVKISKRLQEFNILEKRIILESISFHIIQKTQPCTCVHTHKNMQTCMQYTNNIY